MVKFLIGVVFILGLTQEKSEAVDLDSMLLIKELVEVSKKYNTCTSIEDDKKRLACFDGLSSNTKKVDKVSNNQVEMNIKRLKKTRSCNECDLTGANLSGFSIGSVVQLRRAILSSG